MHRPVLYISQILAWADAFSAHKGRWPTSDSGRIRGTSEENWRRVDSALRLGLRGLVGGSSLARLLAEQRGVRNQSSLPKLSAKHILAWADAFHERTGRWPTSESGRIDEEPEETWRRIDNALRLGIRGLPGGTSLSRLLAQRRAVRNIQDLPRLTEKQILAWADAHHRRHGSWPTSKSEAVYKAPGETWSGISTALKIGRRGLPGGTSLARLLAKKRGVRNPKQPPQLTVTLILRWAKTHYQRTGEWPTRDSGPIPEAAGETWAMIDRALRKGQRSLKGKSSLYRLLKKQGAGSK